MNINLHIEELILEGVDIPRSQRDLLQATVESELARLLTDEGLPSNWQSGEITSVSIPPIEVTPKSNSTEIGQQIAQAVYQGMSS